MTNIFEAMKKNFEFSLFFPLKYQPITAEYCSSLNVGHAENMPTSTKKLGILAIYGSE